MAISLEVVNAFHGDCLLLRYGGTPNANLVLIDGGPLGTFEKNKGTLYDVLEKHRMAGAAAKGVDPSQFTLPLELVMVSHIDDDHVHGIANLFSQLAERQANQQRLPYKPAGLWHNAFDDLLHNRQVLANPAAAPATAQVSNEAAQRISLLPNAHSALVANPASVAQGRKLRDDAAAIPVPVNGPFAGRGGLAWAVGVPAADKITLPGGLVLHLISPPRQRLEALQAEWDKQIKAQGVARAAEYADTSVFNLSSIVVLAEYEGKRLLFTGDARGDDILAGLEQAGLLPKNGTMKIDLLKLPHHGSIRDVDKDFFERIIADHYVVSADGKYENPDPPTLQLLCAARNGGHFTLYQTNKVPKADELLAALKHQGAAFTCVYRDETKPSLVVSL